MATGPSRGFRTRCDGKRQKIAHKTPFFHCLECRLCALLLRRSIGKTIEKRLHQRRPDYFNRKRAQRLGLLGKAKQIAIVRTC